MKNKSFNRYYLFSCIGVLIASYYPLSMGIRVIADMITSGTVMKENYPKYIIPYTPICLAVIAAVLLMPVIMKLLKRFAFIGGSVLAIGTFFALETLFEQKVVVTTAETVSKLEDWQMFMLSIVFFTLSQSRSAISLFAAIGTSIPSETLPECMR